MTFHDILEDNRQLIIENMLSDQPLRMQLAD